MGAWALNKPASTLLIYSLSLTLDTTSRDSVVIEVVCGVVFFTFSVRLAKSLYLWITNIQVYKARLGAMLT